MTGQTVTATSSWVEWAPEMCMWLVPLFFVLLSWQPTEARAESFTCQELQEIRERVDWSLHEELAAGRGFSDEVQKMHDKNVNHLQCLSHRYGCAEMSQP